MTNELVKAAEPIAWPPRPTAHDEDWQAQRFGQASWREPIDVDSRVDPGRESYRPFRTCSYCGSIHPEDLFNALQNGAQLHGADWKYGWPHKFYIDGIPHEHPDREVWRGGRSTPQYRCRTCGFVPPDARTVELCAHVTDRQQYEIIGSYREDTFAPVGQTLHAKWYNVHLLDLSAAAFAALAPLLKQHAGIEWNRTDGKLGYSAPYRGYQRS